MFPAVADATHMRTNGVLWRGWLPVSRGRRIELSVHCCFPATLVAVTWLLAMACFPRFFPGWHPAAYWLVATTVAPGFPAASNFAAGLLNLVPISPLDGARVARALIAGLVRV